MILDEIFFWNYTKITEIRFILIAKLINLSPFQGKINIFIES